jgi:hypothetical protein
MKATAKTGIATVLVGATIVGAALMSAKPKPAVVFESPTETENSHGVYRWDAKVDDEQPPASVGAFHKITPSTIAGWPEPSEPVKVDSPRMGIEREWFELVGRVVLAKVEADGDIHIQLADADGKNKVQVVVEIPTGPPWDAIRKEVFSWTSQTFPFKTESSKPLRLKKHPVIRVTGKAFYDGEHRGPVENRRRDAGNGEEVTVFELHPIMRLEVVKE